MNSQSILVEYMRQGLQSGRPSWPWFLNSRRKVFVIHPFPDRWDHYPFCTSSSLPRHPLSILDVAPGAFSRASPLLPTSRQYIYDVNVS